LRIQEKPTCTSCLLFGWLIVEEPEYIIGDKTTAIMRVGIPPAYTAYTIVHAGCFNATAQLTFRR
jgi:hypothetical protein